MTTRQPLTLPVPATVPGRPLPPSRPAALVYTILRHGRGLSHEDAVRKSRELLPEPPPQAA